MNNFLKFVKKFKDDDSIVGDFCSDISRDGDFPINGTVKQMQDYVQFQASRNGTAEQFIEFTTSYTAFAESLK